MIVNLKLGADSQAVERHLSARGLWVQRLVGDGRCQFLVDPASRRVQPAELLQIDGIESVARAPSAHPLIDAHPAEVDVAGQRISAASPVLIAGPCSVESEEQIDALAARVAALGARFLRGGAFKPRTSPYSFQGHGPRALEWQRAAADRHGLRVVSEALNPEHVELVASFVDLIQIGSRNMQNFALLCAAARQGRPVLLKRGMAATLEEWLSAAEYCLHHGAPSVVMCERGVRGFDPSTRNLLDLGAVALLSQVYGLPVVVDPSHAAGRRDLIPALSRAALSAGAAGLMLETHDEPAVALSDGPQALPPEEFARLVSGLFGGN